MADTNWAKKRFYEQLEEDNATAEEDTLQGSQIDLLNSAVITHISAWDIDTNITRIDIMLEDENGDEYLIKRGYPSAANEAIEWDGKIVMEAYDRIKIYFFGTVLNDDIRADVLGYIIPQFKSQTERT